MTFLNILYSAAFINFALFVFNLIPIPPLDGSHIVFSAIDIKPETEVMLRKFGMPALLIILLVQNFTDITILPIGRIVNSLIGFFT